MEQLTKAQFIELDIEEQIKYLNDRLSDGNTVEAIRKGLGIGKKWLQGHMKANGYSYNYKEKIYKHSTSVETNNISLYQSSTSVEKDTSGKDNALDTKVYNSREMVVDKEQFNMMLKSYKEIEQMNEKLEAVYKWYEKEHEVVDVTPKELKIDKFEGEATARAYKFYPDVQQDFIDFCNKHTQYKKQDIICQALKEFLDKYK